ncbi:hypothetical protein L0665_07405 [Methanogenium marinum]|uniref:Uncharacterized protein n=1 Tax=Methanogenium marinum TaxID=348610 RepID=A0A9Q4KUB3_9EURY|nr:hypothetical protein [Methanogenium marinum]MDE4908438.1 hypothetical protein [Methanogenium marinum]
MSGVVSAESIVPELPGISDVYGVGEEITLGGETNLAPGTKILITIEGAEFRPSEKGGIGALSGTSGMVVVQDGIPSFWSFSFTTRGWEPGEYLVIIEVPKTGTVVSGSFSLLPAGNVSEMAVSSLPTVSPSDTPESSPLPLATSPTSVPLSPAAGVAGFVVFYLFRAYFS